MNISIYISQLLYRYQCVTVPGFGAFLTESISASVQETNHTFFPPKKNISFNAYLKNNDGLLANHIAVVEKMSYTTAVQAIENEVVFWKEQLQKSEVITLKNIGLLRTNSEGNVVFESFNPLNYLTDSFGLTTFVSPVVKREEAKKFIEEIAVVEKPTLEFIEETSRLRPFLKYAALFVISVGGLGFGYSAYVNQQEQIATMMVQAEVQKELKNKIQEATFFIDNPASPIINTVNEVKTLPFHIVAGAFRSKENAEQTFNKLTSEGFKARILDKNEHGLFPVLYGSYATYTEAQYEMTQIQNSTNSNAWLLIEEL